MVMMMVVIFVKSILTIAVFGLDSNISSKLTKTLLFFINVNSCGIVEVFSLLFFVPR